MVKHMIKKCLYCNIEFEKDPRSSYCSRRCAYSSPLRQNKINQKRDAYYANGGIGPMGWLGKKRPASAVEKNRQFMLGRFVGKKNPMWKGGITNPRHKVLMSQEYKDWRMSVFRRDNFTCQECGDKSGRGYDVVLNADHIKPYALYPESRFDINNGRTLCVSCHRKTPTYGIKTVRLKLQTTI